MWAGILNIRLTISGLKKTFLMFKDARHIVHFIFSLETLVTVLLECFEPTIFTINFQYVTH